MICSPRVPGLLECARRLGWALNTVKRHARAERVEEFLRPSRYGACLVGPHRDLVRQHLAEKMPVTRILAEIQEHGYTGSVLRPSPRVPVYLAQRRRRADSGSPVGR